MFPEVAGEYGSLNTWFSRSLRVFLRVTYRNPTPRQRIPTVEAAFGLGSNKVSTQDGAQRSTKEAQNGAKPELKKKH